MSMSGVMGSLGSHERFGEMQCAFFRESDGAAGIALDVVVIHRLAEQLPRRGLFAGLREMLTDVWGLVKSQPSRPTPLADAEPGWGNASGIGGPFEVRFNAERRLVRAARREIALPSRGTMVVLIDMRDASDEHPDVSTAVVDIPMRPRETTSRSGRSSWRERAEMTETLRSWNAAIDNDPAVRAFRARMNSGASGT